MNTKDPKSHSVLIIDDDKFLLDMYTMKFKDCGCSVEGIADPVAALEKLRGGATPSIILLDIVMPVLDGFEFLEAVRKEHLAEKSAIIMLSNQGQQEDIEKSMKLGASGYIVKASSIPSEVIEKSFSIADTGK